MIIALLATPIVEPRRTHGLSTKAPPMFIFGSSYVDTGNLNPNDKETWPGAPAGRFSNGYVLTDAIAEALNMSMPTNFQKRRVKEPNGLNFASGGSGVLAMSGLVLPISSQIESFQSVISSYTPQDLASAIVIYSPSGDDYYNALTTQALPLSSIYPLTANVGKQISADLVKLYGLGLRKFLVTYLPPTGCLPLASAMNMYRSCNDTWTTNVAQPHNARVFKNVLGLRHYFKNGSIALLDLYSAFSLAQAKLGNGSLKPCCIGHDKSTKCGNLDARGEPAYRLCSNPSLGFYWDDTIHPTEAGWKLVVKQFQHILLQIVQ
ncbi:hypothetical protein GOP47_0027239 [Adiantum capillus-veneris]|nr:hypothetical protein GOP47_0027239 [Adiantum capillus-veneris]